MTIQEQYKFFVENCSSTPKSYRNYSDFKRICSTIAKIKNINDFDIYSVTSSEEMEDLIKSLSEDKEFIQYNKTGGNQYSNALQMYLRFLKARAFFSNSLDKHQGLANELFLNKYAINQSLLSPDELIDKVRECFTRFVHLINVHTNDFTNYIADFEKYINPLIQGNFPQYKNVFQIVDIDVFNGVIAKLQEKDPELKNVFADEYKGTRYAAFRTTKYYRWYLEILAFSDFRSNIDKQSIKSKEFINTSKQIQLNKPLQQIYYGAPGTGKSFTIDDLTDDDNSVRITFHPDTDYASFVGAYKPTMKDMPLSAFVGKEVHRAQPKGEHPGTEQRIVYKYVPQAFLKAYVAAWSNINTPYYLIIEEINRGNCAQIFGDLFQLLDRNNTGSSSYAINADEDIAKFLKEDEKGFASLSQEQRNTIAAYELVKDNGKKQAIGEKILDGTLLLLPHNLHIWATMNTSDQSLFPIDSAFKRRWNWKYVPIDTNPTDKRTQQPFNWKFEVAGNLYSWGKFLEFINPKIYDITESSDKQMGYFFAKADPATGIISEEVFLNKVLFYLWTDVFKDYEVSDQIFNNKNNNNKPFRFTDFFEDAEALANFIGNCGLEVLNDNSEDFDTDEQGGESAYYNFISDGVKCRSITKAFRYILRNVCKKQNIDFETIKSAVEQYIQRDEAVIKQIESADTYEKENGWNSKVLTTCDNISFVVTNQWKKEFLPMVKALAKHFDVGFEEK